MSEVVYIGLGSNVGDRESNIKAALKQLCEKLELIAESSLYESEPMYLKHQAWFLNCAAEFRTQLEPIALLEFLKEVEARLGRIQTIRYGPRSIDLDILFYGDSVLNLPNLKIPHPLVQERRFVLAPLAEIAPDYIHPVLHRSVADLLSSLRSSEIVRKMR